MSLTLFYSLTASKKNIRFMLLVRGIGSDSTTDMTCGISEKTVSQRGNLVHVHTGFF